MLGRGPSETGDRAICGICGILDFRERPRRETLASMTASLAHRGPDGSGLEVDGPIGLGHRRLRILDLTPRGRQPMSTSDGRFTIVYNGEVYNFRELREELEGKGVRFRSGTDTEVVLEAYAHYGTDVVSRLNGMFAFGIWERDRERLVLARDRFGIKPLFWSATPGGLTFGSEIKALLRSGRVDRGVDPGSLHEYVFYGTTHGRKTLFDRVHQLLPGHLLIGERGGTTEHAFWRVEYTEAVNAPAERAAVEVRKRLEESVKRHLVADVPVSVFLSGGIDSTAITAFASRAYGQPLRTYSVGFDFDQGVNELPKARRMAEHFGTDHHELHLEGSRVGAVIESLVEAHDQPFGDAAGVALHLLCRELGDSEKVVLQGDGGDEMFAGYRRYAMLRHAAWFRLAAQLKPFFDPFARRNRHYIRYGRFVEACGDPSPHMRMARLLTQEPLEPSPLEGLAGPLATEAARADAFSRYRELAERLSSLDDVQRMLWTDASIILPDIFCAKVDRTTMAHGIEVRVPFLDTSLAGYAMGLPSELKVRRGEKKWILRQALRGTVPDEILDGPKTGFGVPAGFWLREKLRPMLQEVVLDPRPRRAVRSGDPGTLDRGPPERRARLRLPPVQDVESGPLVPALRSRRRPHQGGRFRSERTPRVVKNRPSDLALVAVYPPPHGGVATHVRRLLPHLEARGIRYTVYNAVSDTESPPTVISVARRRGQWLLGFLVVAKEPVVYLFSHRLAAWVVGALMVSFRGKRLVIRLRNQMLPRLIAVSPWKARLAGWALRRATGVVCVSTALADAARSVGVTEERLIELPGFLPPSEEVHDRSSVAEETWSFLGAHDPVIAANGKISRYDGEDLYGLDLLVELAARLKPDHPKVGIVVCFWDHGPDDEAGLDALLARARELGVADHVLFQTKPGLFVPVLAQANVFVRPTNTDGDANSVREAIYLGVPAIASDVVARPEGTVLFRSRDPDDLLAKVEHTLGVDGSSGEASRRMKERTDARLSRYLDYLESLVP